MEFSGIIHHIAEIVHVSATFKKRSFVIESSETKGTETYTELVSFEFIQDKCDLLDSYKVGDSVEVLFNLKGRVWQSPQGETKYFNTLQSWQIHSAKDEDLPTPQAEIPQAAPQSSMSQANPAPAVEMPKFDGEEDDIAF